MWVAFRLGVVGNWSWKGVMPMKWLGVRPDTSKPPTRRITSRGRRKAAPGASKPPTRRITLLPGPSLAQPAQDADYALQCARKGRPEDSRDRDAGVRAGRVG